MKQLIPSIGILKLLSLDSNNEVEMIPGNILFFESSKKIRLRFEGISIEISFRQHEEGEIRSNENFKFPRFKYLSDEYFIFSGLLRRQEKLYLAVGRFQGKIPLEYPQYQDSLEYPINYWQ